VSQGSKPGDPKGGPPKLGGGLSASDLRARLGLKPSSRGAGEDLRARLGLLPPGGASKSAPPAAPPPSPIKKDPDTRSIEQSLLDTLLREGPGRGKVSESAGSVPPDVPASSLTSLEDVVDDDFDAFVGPGDGQGGASEIVDELSSSWLVVEDDLAQMAAQAESAGAPPPLRPPGPAKGAAPLMSAVSGYTMPKPDVGDLVQAPPHLPQPESPPPAPVPAASAPIQQQEDLASPAMSGSSPIVASPVVEERTTLLDSLEDEEFDAFPDSEKTQVMMSAMDYDPLSGRLIVESGKAPQKEYALPRDRTTIGRGTKNEVVIPDIAMSRQHFAIERRAEGFMLRDLDSGNGTQLNGRRITSAQLRSGDVIEAGNLKLRFEQSGGDPDVLWKGAPRVEYHPRDKGMRSAASSTSGGGGAAAPVSPQAAPVMQPMIQRPGGIPGQAWGGAQNPYMNMGPWANPQMGYVQGFTQQGLQHMMLPPPRRSSPIITALIVFFGVLLLGLVVLIVGSLLDSGSGSAVTGKKGEAAGEAEAARERKQAAAELVTSGTALYEQGRLAEARKLFQDGLTLDGQNVTAKLFLEEVLPREQLVEEQLKRALMNVKENPTVANHDRAMQVLGTVPADSTFYGEVQSQHIPQVKRSFQRVLIREAKRSIYSKNYERARADLRKIEVELGIANDPDVKELLLQISELEKAGK